MDTHHWITLHRVRFPQPIAALERSFERPDGPECWRFCPGHAVGADNLPTWVSDTWCGFGIHDTECAARSFFAAAEQRIAACADGVEMWHALAVPVQHRGAVNWRGSVETDGAIKSADADVQGPLAIVTTAGFEDPKDPTSLPRISRFVVKVSEAIAFRGAQPGNLRCAVFNGGFDGREGLTLTLWKSDDAMLRAAYHSGHHRNLMDESRDGSVFDRSSFSRLRIIDSRGSWDGDPLRDAA
ncbi:MAG: hypothetical protein AAF678_13690 [Pseudomonadota bacterium]